MSPSFLLVVLAPVLALLGASEDLHIATAETSIAEGATQEALILTVDECVARAVVENPQAGMALERILKAEYQVEQARSGKRPQVSSGAAYNYISGLEVEVGGGIADRIGNLGSLRPEKYLGIARIGVDQVLYAGGSLRAAVQAAEALALSEHHQQAVTLAMIAFEVRAAFFDVLLAESLLEVAEESVATLARHRVDAGNMEEAGMVSGFEVLRADTEVAARAAGVVSAQTMRDVAQLQLKRLIGLPQDQALELAGPLGWAPLDEDLDILIAEARAQRPELQALDAAIDAAEYQTVARRGAFKPRAGASVEYQRFHGGTAFNPDGFTVNVLAEWDLYTGGRRKAELHEAESDVRMLALQRKEAEQLIELDVRQAYRQVQEAIARIAREEATIVLGEEGLRLAELRFQEGVGRQADTVDAAFALTQAKTGHVQALRDYAVASAALSRAIARP